MEYLFSESLFELGEEGSKTWNYKVQFISAVMVELVLSLKVVSER